MELSDSVVQLRGSSGPVTVASGDFPIRSDRKGRRGYPYPDFGADLIASVFRQLPVASRSGPPWARRTECGACGGGLAEEEEEEGRVEVAVEVERLPRFHLAFGLPVLRCARCGAEQVRLDREVEFHVAESLASAIGGAGVIPG